MAHHQSSPQIVAQGSIVGLIARKEIVEMARDGRLLASAIFVAVLLVAALGMGAHRWSEVRHERDRAAQRSWTQWLNQSPKDPHNAAHFGLYVTKPVSALGFVEPGIDPYAGTSIHLEAHKQKEAGFRPVSDTAEAAMPLFGGLTASFVLLALVPVVIMLLSYRAFAGERDVGTLRQTLSLGVRPGWLLLGKALGIGTVVLLLLLPFVLAGGLMLLFSGNSETAAPVAMRTLILALAYLLYLGGFIGFSLWVSACARTPQTALVVLLALWSLCLLTAPRLVADFNRAASPTPALRELQAKVQEEKKATARRETAEGYALREKALRQRHGEHVNTRGIELQENETRTSAIWQGHWDEVWNRFAQHERIYRVAAVLSPMLTMRSLSMAFAGTDLSHQRHFARAAEEYRLIMVAKMNEDLAFHSHGDEEYKANDNVWRRVPPFQYEPPSTPAVLAGQWPNFALLAAWCMLPMLAAVAATRRMRLEA